MELSEVRRRRTVRHGTDRPLSREVVERVLDAALRAPSAGPSQGGAFPALTDPADRARFRPFVPTRASATVEQRRRRKEEVVHRGHWGRQS